MARYKDNNFYFLFIETWVDVVELLALHPVDFYFLFIETAMSEVAKAGGEIPNFYFLFIETGSFGQYGQEIAILREFLFSFH